MTTLFLKFEDEQSASDVMEFFDNLTIDVVGEVFRPTGGFTDTELGPMATMALVPGWHVNVLDVRLPEALQPYEVHPETPSRVFAIEPEPLRVPQEVSMGQCRLALHDQHGIETEGQFYALVDMLPESERARALIELSTRPTVRRDNPLVLLLGQSMGWDLDALFVYAGGL